LPNGQPIHLRVSTRYPEDGRITVAVLSDADVPWTLSCRVPAWATQQATISVDGESHAVDPGYATVTRAFAAGQIVELSLPVTARWTWPDSRIDALRGQVAVERGPLVMCLESIDLGASVNDVSVVADDPPVERDGRVYVNALRNSLPDPTWPYSAQPPEQTGYDRALVPLIPYHAWANRGPSTMRVWLPANYERSS
jgi:DUF1680 family protein